MNQHRAIVFDCEGASLVGVAEIPSASRRTAVIVVTGGPQYRVGSHRQFTLLCRHLADDGFASLRFDFRGSGDSDGSRVSFVDLRSDINAAINQLLKLVPEVSQVVLLGLCDAASAALIYAHSDPRVAGVVMLNPWVRATGSLELARVRGYFPSRLRSGAFWKRLFSGKVNVLKSLQSLRQHLGAARGSRAGQSDEPDQPGNDYLQRMLTGARRFKGQLLVVLSGQDMTAQEYRDLIADSEDWGHQMAAATVQHREIAEANHTFANAQWRTAVADHSLEFVRRLEQQPERKSYTSSSAGGG